MKIAKNKKNFKYLNKKRKHIYNNFYINMK